MNWNFQRSKDRLASEWARIQEAGLNIQRLTREMDLTNLSPTDARIVHGAHIYCHIANFSDIIDTPLMRRDDFKRLHRLLHILRVEQRHTLQQIFDGDKIQVQGPKFHGLLFKPYDDDEGRRISNNGLEPGPMPGIHSQSVVLVEGDADEIVPNPN